MMSTARASVSASCVCTKLNPAGVRCSHAEGLRVLQQAREGARRCRQFSSAQQRSVSLPQTHNARVTRSLESAGRRPRGSERAPPVGQAVAARPSVRVPGFLPRVACCRVRCVAALPALRGVHGAHCWIAGPMNGRSPDPPYSRPRHPPRPRSVPAPRRPTALREPHRPRAPEPLPPTT